MTTVAEHATPTTAELLLAWDASRPRSQQIDIGWSDIGGCRRRAGYRMHHTVPSNTGGSVQAVLGTAVHDAYTAILKQLQAAGRIPAEDLIEHEVTFAGVTGHLDRYEHDTLTVDDLKTSTDRWIDHVALHGPPTDHRWQVSGYAAGLIAQGIPVRHVRLDYVARDTGRIWTWGPHPVDKQAIADAVTWIKTVASTPLDLLARDYAPDSSFCQHCPFRDLCWEGGIAERDPRTVLYVVDPDATAWAERLWRARRDKADAEAREAEARGALDALRPDLEPGQSAVVDIGWRHALKFTYKRGAKRLDRAAVEADYRAAGGRAPTVVGEPSVSVTFTEAPSEAGG